jgi:hypothetical protein
VTPDTDSTESSTSQPTGSVSPAPETGSPEAAGPGSGSGSPSIKERAAAISNERPEAAVGAAFAGGLLLALILKRLAR